MEPSSAPTESLLLEPFRYLERSSGKNLRVKLIDAFNAWLEVPEDILTKIKDVVQMLHNASLLVDDIEDRSKLRRGAPVAHAIYGVPLTLNTANYVYFIALQEIHALKSHDAVSAFVEEMLQLHVGQGKDIYWREFSKCPSEEEYSQMVIDKTGGLFRLAVRIIQSFSVFKGHLIPLVNLLGLYFQIMDDFLNVHSRVYHHNKSFCEDLTEGKFSFPVIHSITHAPAGDSRLLNILKQRTEEVQIKEYAVRIMEETGSFEYTMHRLDEIGAEIDTELAKLGGNPALQRIVNGWKEAVHTAYDERKD